MIASRSSFRDGEFPGVAAFCLLGLLLALGAVALAGLRPWATDSVGPKLSLAPDLGASVEGAEVVVRQPSIAIAPAREAPGIPVALASEPVAYAPAPVAPQPAMAVAPGYAVQVAEAAPAPPAPSPVETQPVATPVPAPAPEVISAPASPPAVAVGTGGGEGPIRSGVEPEPACEGNEYTVIVYYELDEATGEQVPVEILIQHTEADGGVSELSVEGDLTGYGDLIAALAAEGGCVTVEYKPAEAEEVPEAPEETPAESAVTLEPVLP